MSSKNTGNKAATPAVSEVEDLPPEPVTITFVTWQPDTDTVAIKHDGQVVWQENTFDGLSEYLRFAPLGVPVILQVEQPYEEAGEPYES